MLTVSDYNRACALWLDLITLPLMFAHRIAVDSLCNLAEAHARHMLEQALKDLDDRFKG